MGIEAVCLLLLLLLPGEVARGGVKVGGQGQWKRGGVCQGWEIWRQLGWLVV